MTQRRRVLRSVVVLTRRHGHGLWRAPIFGGEGQRVLGAERGAAKGDVGARIPADGHRHIAGGLGGQLHRVVGVASLRDGERRRGDGHIGGVIFQDVHGDAAGGNAGVLARTADGMSKRHWVLGRLDVVIGGGYDDGLGRVPVVGGEGQLVVFAQRLAARRQRRAGMSGDDDGHVGGGLGVEHHVVGLAAPLHHVKCAGGNGYAGVVIVCDRDDVLVGCPEVWGGCSRQHLEGLVVLVNGVVDRRQHQLRRASGLARNDGQLDGHRRVVGVVGRLVGGGQRYLSVDGARHVPLERRRNLQVLYAVVLGDPVLVQGDDDARGRGVVVRDFDEGSRHRQAGVGVVAAKG